MCISVNKSDVLPPPPKILPSPPHIRSVCYTEHQSALGSALAWAYTLGLCVFCGGKRDGKSKTSWCLYSTHVTEWHTCALIRVYLWSVGRWFLLFFHKQIASEIWVLLYKVVWVRNALFSNIVKKLAPSVIILTEKVLGMFNISSVNKKKIYLSLAEKNNPTVYIKKKNIMFNVIVRCICLNSD